MTGVLISDLDGTLLNDDGSVPTSFTKFLNLLAEKRIILIFASSRSPQNIQKLFLKFNFEYYSICSDGSSFVRIAPSEIELLKETNLPNDVVRKTISELASLGIDNILLFTNHSNKYDIYCLKKEDLNNDILKEVLSDGRKLLEIALDFESIFFDNKQIANSVRAISLFDTTEVIENIYEKVLLLPTAMELKVYKYPETRIYNMEYSWIDIIPKNLSKGMIVNDLKCSMLQERFIIALGNGVNDRELFQESDLTFCPMNSDMELMKMANTIVREKNGELFINEVSKHILNLII